MSLDSLAAGSRHERHRFVTETLLRLDAVGETSPFDVSGTTGRNLFDDHSSRGRFSRDVVAAVLVAVAVTVIITIALLTADPVDAKSVAIACAVLAALAAVILVGAAGDWVSSERRSSRADTVLARAGVTEKEFETLWQVRRHFPEDYCVGADRARIYAAARALGESR